MAFGSASTFRGREIQAKVLAAIAAQGERQRAKDSIAIASLAAQRGRGAGVGAFFAAKDQTARATTLSPIAAASLAPSVITPEPMPSLLDTIGGALNNLINPAPTATGPTPPAATTTVGTLANLATSALNLIPGVGPVVAGAGNAAALAVLPGRATTPAGGMSEYLLERPTGATVGATGTAMSYLQRLGIPKPWTRKKVRSLVRFVGPGQAAAIIGAPLESVAIVAVSAGRRNRGISARDLRTTRRVTRKVLGIARDLAAIRPPAARRSSSRTSTRVVCN